LLKGRAVAGITDFLAGYEVWLWWAFGLALMSADDSSDTWDLRG
jgi:hypothetical protein